MHPFPHTDATLRDPSRLEALSRAGLMDTPAEPAFDRSVRLATRLLGTPVALVSLVDEERQFFKAQTGLSEPTASARQTPLSHSFCQHVVKTGEPLVVIDAREDPLVRDNMAIGDLGVIAYLGIPIRAPGGAVLGSFCAIQSEPRDWTEEDREALSDIAAGVEAEIALRSELDRAQAAETAAEAVSERMRLALRAGQVGTYSFDPVSGIAQWDEELFDIWGMSPDVDDVFVAAEASIHPDDKAMWEADVAATMQPNGTGRHDLEMRIIRPDTGETRWVHAVGQATFEASVAIRILGTVRDITERKTAETRERLLTRELNHRVKNLFAVVSGMVGMTARTATTPKEMADGLRSRVNALARAHALIQPAVTGEALTTTDVTFQTLASAILAPHGNVRDVVSLTGPVLPLNAGAASSLALVLHELATNAAKYGALSVPDGRLEVEWQVEEHAGAEPRLHVEWTELGGPAITEPPSRKGFGSILTEMTVRGQMAGTLDTRWLETGVQHVMSLSLTRLR